ncbi:6846_t:CDS:2 [Funneliformis caledonium]|uniref:6846_t:CDS:1 n=1 Tax=Funneliformis caledonium TaxID=1117310 RepID=A0A9N8VK15_9GLOM|nr:6846_t:CDS:2 [Funneliformis caledonium]
MVTYKGIEQELNDAKGNSKNLKEEIGEFEKKKEELKEKEHFWRRQMKEWRKRLREFGGEKCSSINNQAVDKFQYYQLYVNKYSKASDKEKVAFMDFISQNVSECPKVSYEEVVKAFQESQASGIKKSKLLKKIAEDIRTIYCYFCDHNSSEYPPRSYIANVLLSKFRDENDALSTYLAYFCTCTQKSQEFKDSKGWFE